MNKAADMSAIFAIMLLRFFVERAYNHCMCIFCSRK